MKKALSILSITTILTALIMLSSACKKSNSMTLCYNFAADTIKAGGTLTFTNCSQNVSSVNITFGDGTYYWGDPEGSFSHSYPYPGTYTITIVNTDVNGHNLTLTKNIIVLSTGGTWTFESYVSAASTCYVSQDTLIGVGTDPNGSAKLEIIFPSLPTTGGTYTLVNGPLSYGQATILYTNSAGSYLSYTSGYTIQVTVTGGKISASGSSITLANIANSSDNGDMTLALTQQ